MFQWFFNDLYGSENELNVSAKSGNTNWRVRVSTVAHESHGYLHKRQVMTSKSFIASTPDQISAGELRFSWPTESWTDLVSFVPKGNCGNASGSSPQTSWGSSEWLISRWGCLQGPGATTISTMFETFNKPQYYITLSWKGLPGTNALASWAHC
jgi:hypothetical protein